ncbi:ribosome export GTPase [Schizosaccharomyces octosporus yFS286]|uniref:Nucleolar GTP-binding protein 2 n=1 Tax=Schizosaccharomyces octosporus (strain yFS286) TaxID=483514 RepID=S9RAW2_SCHOY|nr:ribosome export GTPase [Schizosaccharomyces octosporus yFS286]EPX75280.1 ribosome export GTPase [Schizosaccharomyces octosporus yFS286]
MGTFKKEKSRLGREGSEKKPGNLRVKGENFYRNAKDVAKVNMFRGGKAKYNAQGELVRAADFQSKEVPKARVQPDRRWFNNTRVIAQPTLTQFREAMGQKANDPYQVLLRRNKLPMSLLEENSHIPKVRVLESEPFDSTFGPRAQRKRPKLAVDSLSDLANASNERQNAYEEKEEERILSNPEPDSDVTTAARDAIFNKGQSKRIWNELYKVIDSSDVLLQVLDARDPMGTRCRSVERYLKKEAPHKHMVLVLNKIDLVPTSVAAAWTKILAKEYPTIAFHASINNSFGKGSLIQILRQYASLHSDKKQVSVGLVGYPNAGKSSIINTLRKKKVCNVAPIPGETKVWQYVTLMKRIFLIDCPGIVPPSSTDSDADLLLKGVVRVENVSNPEAYIPTVLTRCKNKHLERTYEISGWNDSTEFLCMLAKKSGRLLKGGEADEASIAKMVLNDFMRGKIPWFVGPKGLSSSEEDTNKKGNTLTEETNEEEVEEGSQEQTNDDGEEEEWNGIEESKDAPPAGEKTVAESASDE